MGGARDATNVILSSDLALSIITTVGEEHLDALGGSLESIAVAKSGIVKTGRPVRWFFLLPVHWIYFKINSKLSGIVSDLMFLIFCLVMWTYLL